MGGKFWIERVFVTFFVGEASSRVALWRRDEC